MQKGKPFVYIWRDLKRAKEVEILVHVEDVDRYKSNIIKNKMRDVGFTITYPQARLNFVYNKQTSVLIVTLNVSQIDSIPLSNL